MIDLGTLSDRIRKSAVFRAGAAYAVFAFIVVQVATLIQNPFGLNEAFMQTLIWIFLIGFPILLIVAGAVSSRFSTFKILGVFGGAAYSRIWRWKLYMGQIVGYALNSERVGRR